MYIEESNKVFINVTFKNTSKMNNVNVYKCMSARNIFKNILSFYNDPVQPFRDEIYN